MTEASTTLPEKARNARGRIFQAMEKPGTCGALAVALGVSASEITRIKAEPIDKALALIYALGFKVVDGSAHCVDAETYAFLTRSHARVMARDPDLIWKSDSEFGSLP